MAAVVNEFVKPIYEKSVLANFSEENRKGDLSNGYKCHRCYGGFGIRLTRDIIYDIV